MRIWIIKETGEFRRANEGEWIKDSACFRLFDAAPHTNLKFEIVTIVESEEDE